MLSRSDSERQRNLMIHDQRPLPVYFSQVTDTNIYTGQPMRNVDKNSTYKSPSSIL